MEKVKVEAITLIGIKLPGKTFNANGQSSIDCGNLWARFSKENVHKSITGKISDDVYAVYHDYEGDHTQPFGYFIGCKVDAGTIPTEGLDKLTIPAGEYSRRTAKGKIPECIANAWQEIWRSKLTRSYNFNFEVYGEQSKDWNNATVCIYLS